MNQAKLCLTDAGFIVSYDRFITVFDFFIADIEIFGASTRKKSCIPHQKSISGLYRINNCQQFLVGLSAELKPFSKPGLCK
jgi:hypothetical protein